MNKSYECLYRLITLIHFLLLLAIIHRDFFDMKEGNRIGMKKKRVKKEPFCFYHHWSCKPLEYDFTVNCH